MICALYVVAVQDGVDMAALIGDQISLGFGLAFGFELLGVGLRDNHFRAPFSWPASSLTTPIYYLILCAMSNHFCMQQKIFLSAVTIGKLRGFRKVQKKMGHYQPVATTVMQGYPAARIVPGIGDNRKAGLPRETPDRSVADLGDLLRLIRLARCTRTLGSTVHSLTIGW